MDLQPNSRSRGSRGGRVIAFGSAPSASKISEQDGSMISSRKTMCTGSRISGQSAKNTGISDSPAMGTWMAKM